jgi:hypothetical protein
MDPALIDLLQRQQRDGFPDLTGTEVSATIPISERLVNEALAQLLPPNGKVREVRVTVEDGNQATAAIRLNAPSFLPPIPVTVAIEDQPLLPDRPTLGLRLMKSAGLAAMAASFIPSLTSQLPPGIAFDGDRIRIDIRRVAVERNMAEWIDYLTDLRVNTRAGALVLELRVRIRPR